VLDCLGDRLSDERTKKKMTMQQVADKLGIARSTYAGYESGYREPDAEALSKLSDIFNVSIDYIVKGKRSSSNDEEMLTQQEQERLRQLLEDPDMHVAFRKGILGKQANPRRLLKTLELLAMDNEEE